MMKLGSVSLGLFFCLFLGNTVFAQYGSSSYAMNGYPEHNDTLHADTKIPNVIDSVEIPANSIYGGEWNNEHVRVNKLDLTKMRDSALILFNQSDEGKFSYPCKTTSILCSQFGWRGHHHFHAGVDLRLNLKDPIYAAFDGVVRISKYYSGYGRMVVIRHYNGLETLYGHMTKLNVKANQKVKAGEVIGFAGSTGRSSAVHLHFETRYLNEAFNPMHIIDFDKQSLKKDSLMLTGRLFKVKSNRLPYEKTLEPDPIVVVVDTANTTTALNSENKNTSSNSPSLSRGANTNVPVKKVAVSNSTPKQNTGVAVKSGGKKYYVVKGGDTLFSIARRNGTSVDEICKVNKINKASILPVGKKLLIP
ncbi:MAG: peptidoglycan DD-metalloendopeptidase family protein [Bacteroidota bacterium]